MIPVSILGGSGYTGAELMRLLAGHPELELRAVSSRHYQGRAVAEVFPSLAGRVALAFDDADPAALASQAELVFLAVPHGAAMSAARPILAAGAKVLDLSADFRLREVKTYEHYYGRSHTCPELLPQAVYGLTEFYRSAISAASLVANPGCYVTSVLLALLPLLKAGLVSPRGLIANSASGVSGSGRKEDLQLLHGEVHDNFRPYSVTGHRHTPEMEQELSLAAGEEVRLTFTPHLLPLDRGIISTIYALPQKGAGPGKIRACWQAAYGAEPFIQLLAPGVLPATKAVRGGNMTQLAVEADPRSGLFKIFSCLDNLGKGAGGQALQNANLMLGLPETMGLEFVPLWP
jgi:N-acetyl-gamma-glutamyl-phosphate reductase